MDAVSRGRVVEIKENIVRCRRCELADKVTSPVPFYVPPGTPRATVIGEAPGRVEDLDGTPFVGESGRYLKTSLRRAGLEADDLVYLNTVSCWPRGAPSEFNLKACRVHFRSQFLASATRHVLVCGKVATAALLPRARFKRAIAQPIYVHNRLIFPVLHPAAVLYHERYEAVGWKRQLMTFADMVNSGVERRPENCIYCARPALERRVDKPHCGKVTCADKWRKDQVWEMPKLEIRQESLFGESEGEEDGEDGSV